MDEISKEEISELKKLVGFDSNDEHPIKSVKIIDDTTQYTIRIPKRFSDIMHINEKKDLFEFHLIPSKEEGKFELKGVLIKNE